MTLPLPTSTRHAVMRSPLVVRSTTLTGNAGLQSLFSWTFDYFNYPRQLVLSVEDSDFFRVYLAAGQTLEI